MSKKYQNIIKYDVVFEEQEEGGFTVTVPTLPGCISEGDSFEKARKNITDAIKLYLEDMSSEGEKIPSEKSVFVGQIAVKRPSLTL